MMVRSTGACWQRSNFPQFGTLEKDLETEVAIVGGGITGLTTAVLLAEAGKRVALFESRQLAAGVSGLTTAHLTEALDARYHQLEADFGLLGARLARESTRAAIDKIAELSREDSGFARVDGYLFADDEKQTSELDAELEAAQKAGAAVERVRDLPIALAAHGALKFRDQAQLNPTDYLSALATRLSQSGARIYEGVAVVNVDSEGRPRLETSAGPTVRADAVVLATHAPFVDMKVQLQLAQYRSYVVAGRIPRPLGALYWDLADPYHYVRSATVQGEHYLIVGGADHRTGTMPKGGPGAPFQELQSYAARLGAEPQLCWSAQVAESSDGLPFIGRPDADVPLYVAQGFAGNGMTFGTLSAMIISDSLLGRANRYAELYRADRIKPLASAAAVIGENAETAAHFARGHLLPASRDPVETLPAGEGKVFKVGHEKLAVYRDDAGALHAVSAICTHQGCQVAFNPIERSWDCPCHGSRFGVDGEVLDGPAKQALAKHSL